MNKVFSKEELQRQINEFSDNVPAKEFSENMENFSYVSVSNDEAVGFVLIFSNSEENTIVFDQECNHHVLTNEDNLGMHKMMVFSYQEDFGNFSMHFCVDGLTPPSYKTVTIKDLLKLKPVGNTDISNYFDTLFNDEFVDYYQTQIEGVEVQTLMEYSQGYSGKYGNVLSVIKYKEESVAIITSDGKWTDSHDITPISKNYYEMVKYLRSVLFEKDAEEVISIDSEVDIPQRLQGMYFKGIQEEHYKG